MAEKQNKKTTKSKKQPKVQENDVQELAVEKDLGMLETEDTSVKTEDVVVEDEVLNEIENLVQDEKVEEEHIAEDVVEKVKSVEKDGRKIEDPFSIENDVVVQQTLTAVTPKKKVKRQVMIAFDEWNGTYIM